MKCRRQSAAYEVPSMKCWVQGTGYKVLSTKCWIQGATYGVLNMKCWIQGAGCEVALSKTPSLPHLVLTLCLCTLPYLKSLQPPSSLALLASPVLAGGRLGQGWWPELLLLAGGRDLQHLITRQNVMQFHPWTALKARPLLAERWAGSCSGGPPCPLLGGQVSEAPNCWLTVNSTAEGSR